MRAESYEIRVCDSCGLRYPLVDSHAHSFGTRCPACLGETSVALSRKLIVEPTRELASNTLTPDPSPTGREELAVLLDNIRSAWNVGSMIRSADGFGFSHAYLCGITPTPDNEAVQKTSLGAEESVTWSHHKDAVKLVTGLKKEGWEILALEEEERSVDVVRTTASNRGRGVDSPTQPTVLIVGNEVTGVDPELLDLCDRIYCIPMRGKKRSFNAAIAFGIAAYALRSM